VRPHRELTFRPLPRDGSRCHSAALATHSPGKIQLGGREQLRLPTFPCLTFWGTTRFGFTAFHMRITDSLATSLTSENGAGQTGLLASCYAAWMTDVGAENSEQAAGSGEPGGLASAAAQGSRIEAGARDSGGAGGGPAGASAPDADGVVDLLGVLAYASLTAFFRLSDDAAIADSLADKEAMAEMAVAQFGHFQLLRRRLEEMHADPEAAMSPFVAAIDAFHARTTPADWLEGLVKAYVGDGFAADFYRALAELLDAQTRALVVEVLSDAGQTEFAVARVRAAIEADPKVAGRLALWARRLVGEALGQAQRVAAEREALARLLAGGTVTQLGEIGRMFARLTDCHAERMAALGLAS
jgi:tRNA-(MS[2]IO[6]A)-hydroxylase (MiaE)-like